MQSFGAPVVVAINRFDTDTDDELKAISECCAAHEVKCALCEVFAKGGEGGLTLAKYITEAVEEKSEYIPVYDTESGIKDKINAIVTKIYGGSGVSYTPAANKQIKRLEELGLDKKPVCIAKTQYSLSDNAHLLGRPQGFTVNIKRVRISNGAGFIVAEAGDIMIMPGLPKVPAAENIDVDENGVISGLF